MNELTLHQSDIAQVALTPVRVPFDAYLEARKRTILHADDLPFYLLLPEVEKLLETTLDDHHRLLFEVMWYSGARVTEALRVCPRDLVLEGEFNSYVSLETLKRRQGRAKVSKTASRRMVPITDLYFINRLQRYLKTHAKKKLSPVFPFSRQAAYDAVKKWSREAHLPIEVTPHTLRHSFAVNHLLHGQQLHDIKRWMGHSSIKSTEVYLQVLGSDTSHLAARTAFRTVLV